MFLKNIISLILAVFLPISVLGQSSAQKLFDKEYQLFFDVVLEKKPFSALQPILQEYIATGGDINQFFIHPYDENKHSLTFLFYAASNGNYEFVKWLLNNGARPGLVNNINHTVFYYIMLPLAYRFYWSCEDVKRFVYKQVEVVSLLLGVMSVEDRAVILQDWRKVIQELMVCEKENKKFAVFIAEDSANSTYVVDFDEGFYVEKSELKVDSKEQERRNAEVAYRLCVNAFYGTFMPYICYELPIEFAKIQIYFEEILSLEEKVWLENKIKQYRFEAFFGKSC